MAYRSKTLRAWDFIWNDIEHTAGIGSESPTDAQLALRAALSGLCEQRLSETATYALGRAVVAAARVGRESR
jgi:hypothetical protein